MNVPRKFLKVLRLGGEAPCLSEVLSGSERCIQVTVDFDRIRRSLLRKGWSWRIFICLSRARTLLYKIGISVGASVCLCALREQENG
ncbi:hypothetical protein EVA_10717 [gut metagenome]|uniref:Uncharacterized protein n=1 Tax=gut metagenome TaxID=749906 RepID=J9CM56_9ZZZZ